MGRHTLFGWESHLSPTVMFLYQITDLWPGEDWRARIRRAITDNALLFIACFSKASISRRFGYQNEELVLLFASTLKLELEQLESRYEDYRTSGAYCGALLLALGRSHSGSP